MAELIPNGSDTQHTTSWSLHASSRKQVARGCVNRILSLMKKQGASIAEFCEIERDIGAEYLNAKAALSQGHKGMQEWVEKELPGLTWRRVQYCAKLVGVFDQFPAAHAWYVALSPAERLEWKCSNESGARYALQVIALYGRFRDGFDPPPPKAKQDPGEARTLVAAAERQRDEAEAKLDGALADGYRKDAEIARLRFRLAAARRAALRYRREVMRLRTYGPSRTG